MSQCLTERGQWARDGEEWECDSVILKAGKKSHNLTSLRTTTRRGVSQCKPEGARRGAPVFKSRAWKARLGEQQFSSGAANPNIPGMLVVTDEGVFLLSSFKH